MRWILSLVILISIFTSCDHPKKPYIEEQSWPERTVKLDNNLGVLTIRLPEVFDTFYIFNDYDDHTCGDLRKYRFQNSSFQILEESGFFKPQVVDSLSFFTIRHNLHPCHEGIIMNKSWLENVTENHLKHISENDRSRTPHLRLSKIDTINGREFFIIAHENGELYHIRDSIKNLKSAKIMAFTRINKYHILNLDFDCAASNCDSFIPKMYKVLKTVQIKPN